MRITINSKLLVQVFTQDDKVAYQKQLSKGDFDRDEWDEFEFEGKEYEVNNFENGESYIVHLYPYGHTENTNNLIDSDGVPFTEVAVND